jgi:hypothetical protein
MKSEIRTLIYSSIAIVAGVIVLLGYFFNLPILSEIRNLLLRWVVIIAGVAVLVGVVNLAQVHWGKIKTRQSGRFYSVVMLISLLVTLLVVGFYGPVGYMSLWIYNNVQVPIESSLLALLAVVLAYALARLLNRRITLFSIIFLGVVVFVLVGTASLPGVEVPMVREVRFWLVSVWGTAGARGILLGVALGTIATGLRVLMGADRPYGG